MNLLQKYFPELTEFQLSQFEQLHSLILEWNNKINVISRKDTDNVLEHHILHSLAIAKIIKFKPGTAIMDVGTGGGFPALPLAIFFPEVEFTPVDSIAKKIKVVDEISKEMNLVNVKPIVARAETITKQFDFVTARAVTSLPVFMTWINGKFKSHSQHERKNGLLYLKGGDFDDELSSINKKSEVFPIPNFFEEPFFETKKVVYIF